MRESDLAATEIRGTPENETRKPKAQQQRPSCPNDCVLTPEGMVAARRYNGGATRYYYSCRNCRRSFSQIRPDKLPPGHHRNPKWCKPAAAAPPPTSEPSATPKRHRHGRRHKPREWTLRAGQTQGEVALGFHNSSGKLSDEISRKNWIDALLAKLDIVGVCELGADASVQAEMEAAQRQLRDGYKVVFGRATRFNFEEGDGTQSLTRMRRCLRHRPQGIVIISLTSHLCLVARQRRWRGGDGPARSTACTRAPIGQRPRRA